MGEDKALPKGLLDEDVERGRIKRPLVPYIPPVDPIQDVVESKSSTTNFKITLTDGTIVYHAIYENGLNEAFIIHMQEVLNFCKNKGFFEGYKKSKAHLLDTITRSDIAKDKLQEAINDPTTSEDRLKVLDKSLDLASTAVLLATKTIPRKGSNYSPSTRRS